MTINVIGIQILTMCGVLSLGACSSVLHAQANPKVDLALTYTAERGNPVGSGGNFWLQGGSAEAGVALWHGLGVAGNFTGTHSKAFGPSGIPLGLITCTAGPRYRLTPRSALHGASIFGEALFGGVHGFGSIFPNPAGQAPSANAFATQVGGGFDLVLGSRFAMRPIEASWLRTQLPNSTSNTQNDLRLSAGIALRFGRTHGHR